MKYLFSIVALLAILFCGCGDSNVTPNGYQFTRHNEPSGNKPKPGDFGFVHIYTYIDSVLEFSTREVNRLSPIKVYNEDELAKMAESGRPNPVYEIVSMMHVGDSVTLSVPITDEWRKSDPKIANAKSTYFEVVMVESKTSEQYKSEQNTRKTQQSTMSSESIERVKEVTGMMTEIVKQYNAGELKDKITKTSSGLGYMVLEEGTGAATVKRKPVSVHYYGMLTNGSMFDNSFQKGQPYQFVLETGNVITGWHEGVALLKHGDKAVLFIPSELGYGKAGRGRGIPGDSELIFYVEII